MEPKILKLVSEKIEQGSKVAMITLTKTTGSVPGYKGAIMVVFDDGTYFGTIGGGKIEFEVIKRSNEALITGESFSFKYDLASSGKLEMSCGGTVEGFVNILKPNNKLYIFGGGNIAQKVASFSRNLKFDIFVIEDREEYKEHEDFNYIKEYICNNICSAIDNLTFGENVYIVIATRGHEIDFEVIKRLVDKKFAYLGMIGSKSKVEKIKEALRVNNVDGSFLKSIYAPIGLDICDGTPEEIAVSIIAEILAVKNKKITELSNSKQKSKVKLI